MKIFLKYYIVLFFISVSYNLLGNSNHEISPLLKKLEKSSYSEKLNIYNQLIEAYSSIHLDSSLYYYQEAASITKEKEDYKNYWLATNTLLPILSAKSEYNISKQYLDESLEIMQQHGDEELIANVFLGFGTFHWNLSNLKEAQIVLNKALFHTNQAKNLKLKANILKIFGGIFIDMESYDKSLKYLEESYQIFKEINDTLGQANLLNNLGYVYILNQNYDLALQSLNKGLALSQNAPTQNIYELTLANKGDALIGINEIDLGFEKIAKAIQLAKASNNIYNLIICYEIQSRRLLEFKKYDEVIDISKKGIELCKGTGTKRNINRFYKKIAEAYLAKNNYKQSLIWTEKANESKKELLEFQKNKEVIRLQIQHQIQQKEKENELLALEYKNRTFLIALIIATFLVVSSLSFYFFRKKQEALIESFKQKIAADLHDSVGGNLSSIARIAKGLKSPNNLSEINQGIDQLVLKSNTAIKNVVDVIWALDPEENKLGCLIDKIEDSLQGVKKSHNSVEIIFNKENINEEKKLSVDLRHHLLMIFKEAINNIQSHTNPTLIKITLKNSSQQFHLQIKSYFEVEKNISISENRGIQKIKKRVDEMKGTMNIIETKNNFSLNIDLKN